MAQNRNRESLAAARREAAAAAALLVAAVARTEAIVQDLAKDLAQDLPSATCGGLIDALVPVRSAMQAAPQGEPLPDREIRAGLAAAAEPWQLLLAAEPARPAGRDTQGAASEARLERFDGPTGHHPRSLQLLAA